jgi:hypothetical protein
MPWVSRDGESKVNGLFARQQPGIADEQLAEAHADVVAFRNTPKFEDVSHVVSAKRGLAMHANGKPVRVRRKV